MIRDASPRGITAPPEHHHGNAKRKSTRAPTDRQDWALHPSAHEQGWIHTSPGTSALLGMCVSPELPCRARSPAFPSSQHPPQVCWSRLSLCHRLGAVSLSPCRLAVHGSRRLGHWERCFFIVDTGAEPQQPQVSPTTASTALLHSPNHRTFAQPDHFSSEAKPKLNMACSLLSLKTGMGGG